MSRLDVRNWLALATVPAGCVVLLDELVLAFALLPTQLGSAPDTSAPDRDSAAPSQSLIHAGGPAHRR